MIIVVQLPSHGNFVTPWTAACQASLSSQNDHYCGLDRSSFITQVQKKSRELGIYIHHSPAQFCLHFADFLRGTQNV